MINEILDNFKMLAEFKSHQNIEFFKIMA